MNQTDMKNPTKKNVRNLTMIAMLAGISYVLAFLEFPVPLSPAFAKMDLSDFPALIGAFAFSPVAGLTIELVKNALQLTSTSTGGIGELANFIMGGTFVFTAGLIYKFHKTKKVAWISCLVGSLAMGIMAAVMNYFVLLPMFEMFMPLDQVIASFGEFIPFIKGGITDFDSLTPEQSQLYLWQGDITTLRIDAIVNAANSQMLGCFVPCHGCIDNAIHTFAGVQLRIACAELMKSHETPEETGKAQITPAYNLPSKYILHTVGPIVCGQLSKHDCELLASCYRSCLALAEKNDVKAIAFCCISTGEFHFPNDRAAEIAVQTVKDYIFEAQSSIDVLFNVFKESDYEVYKELLKRA